MFYLPEKRWKRGENVMCSCITAGLGFNRRFTVLPAFPAQNNDTDWKL